MYLRECWTAWFDVKTQVLSQPEYCVFTLGDVKPVNERRRRSILIPYGDLIHLVSSNPPVVRPHPLVSLLLPVAPSRLKYWG